jgi:hypothetical protein
MLSTRVQTTQYGISGGMDRGPSKEAGKLLVGILLEAQQQSLERAIKDHSCLLSHEVRIMEVRSKTSQGRWSPLATGYTDVSGSINGDLVLAKVAWGADGALRRGYLHFSLTLSFQREKIGHEVNTKIRCKVFVVW